MADSKKKYPVKYAVISIVMIVIAFVSPYFSNAASAESEERRRPVIDGTTVPGISYATYKITKETSYSQQSGNTYGTTSNLNVVKQERTAAINSKGNFFRTGAGGDICVYSDDIYAIANRIKTLSDEYDQVMEDMPEVYSKAVIAWQ